MTDREPMAFDGRFLWHPPGAGWELNEHRSCLPADVYARLAGHIPRNDSRVDAVVKAYPTREAAMAAYQTAAASAVSPHNSLRSYGGQWTTGGNSEGI